MPTPADETNFYRFVAGAASGVYLYLLSPVEWAPI